MLEARIDSRRAIVGSSSSRSSVTIAFEPFFLLWDTIGSSSSLSKIWTALWEDFDLALGHFSEAHPNRSRLDGYFNALSISALKLRNREVIYLRRSRV